MRSPVMLAKALTINKINTLPSNKTWYIEPKIDGVRAIIIFDTLKEDIHAITRSEKNITDKILPHINVKRLLEIGKSFKEFDIYNGFVLDGEITTGSINTTVSFLNSQDTTYNSNFKFIVFDIVTYGHFEKRVKYLKSLYQRREILEDLFASEQTKHFEIVPYYVDKTENVSKYLKLFETSLDYTIDGIMLKDPSSYYEFDRKESWIKIKRFLTIDGLCIDLQQISNKSEMLGAIKVKLPNNKIVKVGTGFTNDERIKFWKNPHLIKNKIVEIAYHEETDKSLRFPVFVRVRDDL